MGFFSWNCKRCGHPLLSYHVTNKINRWMEKAVVIEADGNILKGDYDGYGRVGGESINIDIAENKEPECYHRSCWELEKKPKKYTSPSDYAEDQGFFFEMGAHDVKDPKK